MTPSEPQPLLTFVDILTLIALIAGPLLAVVITRWMDKRSDQKRRRREIFSTLMRTRRFKLSVDHVSALNLIQIEFYRNKSVSSAYTSYISHLNLPLPETAPAQQVFVDQRDDLFVDLVHAIAHALRYDFDKRDLNKLAYGPIGWQNDDEEARALRRASLELLSGRRPLPIFTWQVRNAGGLFPPVPTDVSPPQ
jgi:hypothetical protein